MSEPTDVVTQDPATGLSVFPWEFVQRIDGLESKSVTHDQLRAVVVLVESLVTRVDALTAGIEDLGKRVCVLEARPSVKSRAEYMRKYRAKVKPVETAVASDGTILEVVSKPSPVSDTPPA